MNAISTFPPTRTAMQERNKRLNDLRRSLAGHTVEQLSDLAHAAIEMLYANVSDAAADEAHEVVIGLQEGIGELAGGIESGRFSS